MVSISGNKVVLLQDNPFVLDNTENTIIKN